MTSLLQPIDRASRPIPPRRTGPPTPVPPLVIDQHARFAYVAMAGSRPRLVPRERRGRGGRVDVSLLPAPIDPPGRVDHSAWLNGAAPVGPACGRSRPVQSGATSCMRPPTLPRDLDGPTRDAGTGARDTHPRGRGRRRVVRGRREDITAQVAEALRTLPTHDAVAAAPTPGASGTAAVDSYGRPRRQSPAAPPRQLSRDRGRDGRSGDARRPSRALGRRSAAGAARA